MRRLVPSSVYDVVVVGARCAGAATAMLLARDGRRVLLVDRGRYGSDTLSTHALMRGAVVQLHRWNVLPAVVMSGPAPIRKATFFYGEDSISFPIAARDGVDALYAPRRYVLDRLLVDAATDAGADVVHGLRLKSLIRSTKGRVNGVMLEDETGQVQPVICRMVVGADGLRSTVASLVEAPVYRAGTHATGTLYGHWTGLDVDGYAWHFVPGLAAGAIPTNDHQVCVFVSVPASEFTRHAAGRSYEAFGELLSQAAPALAAQVATAGQARLAGFAGHAGFFRRSWGPGWALVGDAGYFKDPLTAHGITDALRDAESLAAAIDEGSDLALAHYQAQRDEASLELFETTDAIASFSWTLEDLRVLHESLARSMAREVKQLARA